MAAVAANAIATGQGTTATGTAALLIPSRADRKRLTIINGAAVAVAIGPSTATTVLNGALIPAVAGATLVLETTAAIFAIAASGTPVSWIEEFA